MPSSRRDASTSTHIHAYNATAHLVLSLTRKMKSGYGKQARSQPPPRRSVNLQKNTNLKILNQATAMLKHANTSKAQPASDSFPGFWLAAVNSSCPKSVSPLTHFSLATTLLLRGLSVPMNIDILWGYRRYLESKGNKC